MIVLELHDRTKIRLEDAEAQGVADRLWEQARKRRGGAMLAISIDAELRRRDFVRRPIEVSTHASERLIEILASPSSAEPA